MPVAYVEVHIAELLAPGRECLPLVLAHVVTIASHLLGGCALGSLFGWVCGLSLALVGSKLRSFNLVLQRVGQRLPDHAAAHPGVVPRLCVSRGRVSVLGVLGGRLGASTIHVSVPVRSLFAQ